VDAVVLIFCDNTIPPVDLFEVDGRDVVILGIFLRYNIVVNFGLITK